MESIYDLANETTALQFHNDFYNNLCNIIHHLDLTFCQQNIMKTAVQKCILVTAQSSFPISILYGIVSLA